MKINKTPRCERTRDSAQGLNVKPMFKHFLKKSNKYQPMRFNKKQALQDIHYIFIFITQQKS